MTDTATPTTDGVVASEDLRKRVVSNHTVLDQETFRSEALAILGMSMDRAQEQFEARYGTYSDEVSTPERSIVGGTGVYKVEDGLPWYEPNPRMRPYEARGLLYDHGEFHRMWRQDSTVAAVVNLVISEILRAEWDIVDPGDLSPVENEVHSFVHATLGLAGRPAPFKGGLRFMIRHALLSIVYGFSPVELAWGRRHIMRHGTKFVPTDAQWIAPWSVKSWVWSGRDLIGMIQFAEAPFADEKDSRFSIVAPDSTGYMEVAIPINKVLLFRHQPVDGNPEGTSALRPVWKWYRAKSDTLRRDQIAQDRLFAGIFTVKELGTENGVYSSVSKMDLFLVRKMLEALREGKTNYIVVPYGLEIASEWPTFDAPDHVNEYKYYDHQILLASSSSILGLDATRAASRGLSDGLSAVAYHMMEAVADDVADVINGIPGHPWTGMVSKLVDVNYPNYTGRMPELRPRGISSQDIHKLIDSLSKAAQFLIWTPGAEDEIDFRKAARLRTEALGPLRKRRAKVAARADGGQTQQGDQAAPRQARDQDDIAGGTPDDS